MNLHEKVELEYKFIETANSKVEDNDLAANELEYLIQSYQEGHETLSSMDIVNEMISIIEDMYKKEVEISTLHKVVKIIGKEVQYDNVYSDDYMVFGVRSGICFISRNKGRSTGMEKSFRGRKKHKKELLADSDQTGLKATY